VTARKPVDQRTRELGAIHVLAKQLRMTRDQYEAVLLTVAHVDSAALLDSHGRRAVIEHLRSRLPPGAQGGPTRQRPAVSRDALVRKIRALLINGATRRADAYADAMAQHMFGVERFTWCTPDQLHRLVGALAIDQRRRGR
jgi:Protein of unknown function (DUF1018).